MIKGRVFLIQRTFDRRRKKIFWNGPTTNPETLKKNHIHLFISDAFSTLPGLWIGWEWTLLLNTMLSVQ